MMGVFWSRKLEVVLVGLENSGKTTLLSVLSNGVPVQTAPTIGLNVKLVKRGGVQMKCWDLGGQAQYRQEWGRYTRGCDVIVFVVDTNAETRLSEARAELHRLLEDKELASTPILIVANKIDLEVSHVMSCCAVYVCARCTVSRACACYRTIPIRTYHHHHHHHSHMAATSLQPHASEQTLIRELNLDYITDNAWIIIPCSALKTINVDEVVQWLINKSNA